MSDRASSKQTPPPLAKTEPISKAGGTSVVSYLLKGKKHCTAAEKKCEKNSPANTQVQAEGGN